MALRVQVGASHALHRRLAAGLRVGKEPPAQVPRPRRRRAAQQLGDRAGRDGGDGGAGEEGEGADDGKLLTVLSLGSRMMSRRRNAATRSASPKELAIGGAANWFAGVAGPGASPTGASVGSRMSTRCSSASLVPAASHRASTWAAKSLLSVGRSPQNRASVCSLGWPELLEDVRTRSSVLSPIRSPFSAGRSSSRGAAKLWVGKRLLKTFDGQPFEGSVERVEVEEESGKQLLHVKYDDGDEEDLYVRPTHSHTPCIPAPFPTSMPPAYPQPRRRNSHRW